MTTCAYDKMYLDKAQTALAVMLDYAVNDLKYDIDTFFGMFIKSGIAESFEIGNPKFVVGMSGVELAWDTLYRLNMWTEDLAKPSYNLDRSPEYWAGWALAYFQWRSAISFKDIVSKVPLSRIRDLYWPYHEMDIRQFVDKMYDILKTEQDPFSPTHA